MHEWTDAAQLCSSCLFCPVISLNDLWKCLIFFFSFMHHHSEVRIWIWNKACRRNPKGSKPANLQYVHALSAFHFLNDLFCLLHCEINMLYAGTIHLLWKLHLTAGPWWNQTPALWGPEPCWWLQANTNIFNTCPVWFSCSVCPVMVHTLASVGQELELWIEDQNKLFFLFFFICRWWVYSKCHDSI